MAIVLKSKVKPAPESKIERTEVPGNPNQEVGMKKCLLCEEEHPAKSFKKYEGVEMCAECYKIEMELLKEDGARAETMDRECPREGDSTKEKATKEVLKPMEGIKPLKLSKKELKKIAKGDKEVKVKSSGKPIGKVYTRIVEWQGSYGDPQMMFLVATDPRFFEPDSKIKPLALGAFKASVLAKMMAGEVDGPTIFEYVEKHAKKYAGK